MLVEGEVVKERKLVRPICFMCRAEGKEPHTWGASFKLIFVVCGFWLVHVKIQIPTSIMIFIA